MDNAGGEGGGRGGWTGGGGAGHPRSRYEGKGGNGCVGVSVHLPARAQMLTASSANDQ